MLVRRAIALAHGLAARIWRKEPRPVWVAYAVTALMAFAILLLCVYIGFAAILYVTQRSMMYFPETIHTTPAQAGLPSAQEVTLTAADGVHSIAWHVPPRGDKPVILYFHGNGGALRYRVDRFSKLVADGIGLVALEYRGYGGSSDSPTEAGLIADAEAAYAFAAARYAVKQLVPWGESLGSGVAVALAAEKPVGRVILEAPFTSAAAVAGARYWYFPVRLLMKDQFRSDERIGKVTAPVLILHGARDRSRSLRHGRAAVRGDQGAQAHRAFHRRRSRGSRHAWRAACRRPLPRRRFGSVRRDPHCGTVISSSTWPSGS